MSLSFDEMERNLNRLAAKYDNVDDLSVPVCDNPKWQVPEDYPFKDEVPLVITRPGTDYGIMSECSPDIKEWCDTHNISMDDFNHPCIIDKSCTDCTSVFAKLQKFNQLVEIPSTVTSCTCMFIGCKSFNQPVGIPPTVRTCRQMFMQAITLDSFVEIPDTLADCYRMFDGASSFNQLVNIPKNATNCHCMFGNCVFLNQHLVVPEEVTATKCRRFSDGVVTSAAEELFFGCSSLNRSTVQGYYYIMS